MKHFWTTAAAAALCAFTAQAWGATHHTSKHAKPKAAVSNRHHHGKATHSHGGKATHSHGGKATHGRRGSARVASAIRSEGSASIKVGKGETLTAISRRTGVSVEELAKLNHLAKPYHLRQGAKVKLPSRRYYTVKGGDTLYALSRRFGVSESDLSDFNNIAHGKHIRAGQRLYMPGQAQDTEVPEPVVRPALRPTPVRPTERPPIPAPSYPPETEPETTPIRPQPYATQPQGQPTPGYPPAASSAPPATAPSSSQPPARPFELLPERPTTTAPPAPVRPVPGTSTVRPLIQTNPAPSPADVVTAGKGKFSWPVEGRLITGFGPTGGGQSNDGLNIAGQVGDPVRASADGEVVYAGDQVPSFGNLVLIKHSGGWVTAYAHMSSITVKNRDQVGKGQQIGLVGQTGSVTQPQLHFEIRYAPSAKDKAVPIDPMLLLPQP